MTSVLQRFRHLDQQLTNLALAKRDMDEVRRIQERSTEWKTVKARLDKYEASVRILIAEEREAAALVAKRNAVRKQAAEIRERLQAVGDVAELTRDEAWRRLLSSVKGLAEALENAAKDAWQEAVEECGGLETPATVRALMPPTAENEIAARRYETSFEQYELVAKQRLPTTPSDLSTLRAHSQACRRAYESITFDVPADVRVFLNAVQSENATLAHVTPQVLEWLKEKQQRERFRVRRAAV